MKKNTLLILLTGFIALSAGLFAQYLLATNHEKAKAPMVDFVLTDVTGKQRNSSEWKDKIRIINFWATWCPPCLKEIPEFIKLQQEFQNKGLQFIGVAIEDKQSVVKYMTNVDINYPILIAENEGISLAYNLGNIINAVPFTLIVNRQGQIIHRQPGEISREKILEIIEPIMQ